MSRIEELLEDLGGCVESGHDFEIDAADAKLLLDYIRELENWVGG